MRSCRGYSHCETRNEGCDRERGCNNNLKISTNIKSFRSNCRLFYCRDHYTPLNPPWWHPCKGHYMKSVMLAVCLACKWLLCDKPTISNTV